MNRFVPLLVAAVVFVAGGLIGFRMLISGPEEVATDTACKPTAVAAGSNLDSNIVTVNVFNASTRSGLANRVLIDLQSNGFLGGQIANSTSNTRPGRVAILTNDRKDPRVRLVAAQFRDKVTYAKPDVTVDGGVTVIVGEKYSGLKKKPRTSLKSDRKIDACIPATPAV